jgi:hypothetical protein
MIIVYLLGGIACLTAGFFLTRYVVNIYAKHEQDKFGLDTKGLVAGIGLIMIGIYLLAKLF